MTPVELLLSAVSALAAATVFLYFREIRRADRLEKLLEEERKQRVELSEKNLAWALSLQEKHAAQVDKLAAIAEAQRGRR